MRTFGEAAVGDFVTFDDGKKHEISRIEAEPNGLYSGPRSSKVTRGIRVYFTDRPYIVVSPAGIAPIETPIEN
jgi:hypothetical protein